MPKPKILIADDVEDIRDLIKVYLENLNIELVGEATDGNVALRLIDSLQPDIVFLDIQMPEISGIEILDLIKEKNIFSVIVSGDSDFKTIKMALDKGAQGFIAKPIDEGKIAQIIEKYNASKNG